MDFFSKSIRDVRWCLAACLIFAVSCSTQRPSVTDEDLLAQNPLTHRVTYQGETLGLISKWYTGKLHNWQRIAEANPGLLPERIAMGQEILIPRELVIESRPFPQSMLSSQNFKESAEEMEAEMVNSVTMPSETPVEAVSVPDMEMADPADSMKKKDEETRAALLEELKVDEAPGEVAKEADVEPPAAKPSEEDEREKLLDELLRQ